jgi:hypothetical protein
MSIVLRSFQNGPIEEQMSVPIKKFNLIIRQIKPGQVFSVYSLLFLDKHFLRNRLP